MEAIAIAKNVRVSPKKARIVVDRIRKLPPQKAVQILGFVRKSSSPALKKVILSAIANAKNNHNLAEESLFFKDIQVGKGMVFKRFRAVARGRAHSILRRTSHIRVVLEGQEKSNQVAKMQPQLVAKESKDDQKTKAEMENIKGENNGTKS